jgi:GNAT superfamily N-acetyltransferase
MTASTTGAPQGGRPVGYPHEEEDVVVLGDGRSVGLRPVVPGDLAELQRAIARADAETLRRRFLGGGAPSTQAALRRLVEVDYRHRFALAAFDDGGRGVGIARYEGKRTWPVVEVAVAVDPAWQGAGLAAELVRRVVRRAVCQGATDVAVDFYSDNVRVHRLVAAAHLPERRSVHRGVVTDAVDLRPLRAGSCADPAAPSVCAAS